MESFSDWGKYTSLDWFCLVWRRRIGLSGQPSAFGWCSRFTGCSSRDLHFHIAGPRNRQILTSLSFGSNAGYSLGRTIGSFWRSPTHCWARGCQGRSRAEKGSWVVRSVCSWTLQSLQSQQPIFQRYLLSDLRHQWLFWQSWSTRLVLQMQRSKLQSKQ